MMMKAILVLLVISLPLLVLFTMGYCLIVYIIVKCSRIREEDQRRFAAAAAADDEVERGGKTGLTAEELERLEEGKMLVGGGGDCAVCLDVMEEKQAALRVLPGCRHAFHRSCVDAWLKRLPNCPLCRAHLRPPPASLPPSEPQTQSPSS